MKDLNKQKVGRQGSKVPTEARYDGSLVVLGGQYGDEGKGKFIDELVHSCEFAIVARGNGGPNAGHNIHGPDFSYAAHLMPSGIFSDVLNVVGAGTVMNPVKFLKEVRAVEALYGSIDPSRLMISPRVHIILQKHIEEDGAKDKVGTTRQGNGPAYADKARRTGFQIGELLDGRRKSEIGQEWFDHPGDTHELFGALEELKSFVADPAQIIYDAVRDHRKVLVEGAQGVLLDTNYGTYPFVTSSGTTAAGIVAGVDGLPITAVSDVLGIFKLPMTRVGRGPFVTMLTEAEEPIRQKLAGAPGEPGSEFGATSGRDRDIGWFDAVAARYAIRMAGITEAGLTKLDQYDGFERILLANSYEVDEHHTYDMSIDITELDRAEPIYSVHQGWEGTVAGKQTYEDLPLGAQDLILAIEDHLKVPIKYVGTGTNRNDLVRL